VSDGYFEALGITLVSGRTFTAADRDGATRVCIINESLARRLFPGESPLGRVLLRGRDAEIRSEIVGVIRDVKTVGLNVVAPDEIYFPMRQLARPAMAVVARTAGDPAALQAVLRSAVTAVDKNQPISFFTMDANISGSLGVRRIVTSLTGVFAAIALICRLLASRHCVCSLAADGGDRDRMALGAQARRWWRWCSAAACAWWSSALRSD
jgi:hypothetical protein